MEAYVYEKRTKVQFSDDKVEYSFEEKEGFTPMYYANAILWSDVQAFEIIGRYGKKGLVVRRMEVEQTEKLTFHPGGFSGHAENWQQRWEYKSNPSNHTVKISLRKDGIFRQANTTIKFRPDSKPIEFYDFNF